MQFMIKLKDDSFIYLVLYVDDMMIAAKKKYDIQKLKGLLSVEFEMKDLGATRKILGMEIIRDKDKRKLFLSQRSYIQKVLARFGMSSSKPIDTPSAANIYLTAMFAPQSEEEKEYMSRVPYASAVGILMYAIVCVRSDLAHAVSVAVKRIFRYLRGTSDVGLIYGGDTRCLVTGYSDSDYAGDVDTRRSMTGYVFTLGGSVRQLEGNFATYSDFVYYGSGVHGLDRGCKRRDLAERAGLTTHSMSCGPTHGVEALAPSSCHKARKPKVSPQGDPRGIQDL
uniref:Reverse transcriptase Ty1/copia-type domain-containing protein n=1 Tax=Solanum lycopersicum TaxID=4081 RepID=A0A3Q7I371_SOLLC